MRIERWSESLRDARRGALIGVCVSILLDIFMSFLFATSAASSWFDYMYLYAAYAVVCIGVGGAVGYVRPYIEEPASAVMVGATFGVALDIIQACLLQGAPWTWTLTTWTGSLIRGMIAGGAVGAICWLNRDRLKWLWR